MSVDELDLVVSFLDVGHGDSVIMRFRDGPRVRTVVVDGGGPSHSGKLLAYLLHNGVDTVDLLVATHIDRYHIAGLLPVAGSSRITIDRFWGPSCESTKASVPGLRTADERAYQRLYSIIHDRLDPERILCPTRGMPLPRLFDELTVTVLNPPRPNVLRAADQNAPKRTPAEAAAEQDELSLVLLLDCHRLRLLLGSDIHGPFWDTVGDDPELQRCFEVDILKVPNYGRRSGLPSQLAEILHTEYAVFSLGADVGDRPSPEAISVLQSVGAEVICTEHARQNSFCRNPHCPAGARGQNIVFCRSRGDSFYSTSAYFCPLHGSG